VCGACPKSHSNDAMLWCLCTATLQCAPYSMDAMNKTGQSTKSCPNPDRSSCMHSKLIQSTVSQRFFTQITGHRQGWEAACTQGGSSERPPDALRYRFHKGLTDSNASRSARGRRCTSRARGRDVASRDQAGE